VGSTLVINVPGALTGENILADETGRTWLTDFADAGMAPFFWNYVALEATIRFDWVEISDLLRLQEMEHCLINSDFAKPDIRDLEPNVRKPAQAISMIRKLAARIVGRDERDYHLGLFFQAARRLADHHPGSPLTAGELARLAHTWLAMAMIAEKIKEGKHNPLMSRAVQTSGLRIRDEIARTIFVGNHQVDLAPQPFALLHYLFLNANRVCTKEELIKNVLKNEYKEDYLHTLIGRIRKVIEDDPEIPLYLITVPNAGYRLIPNPE
jgi:DNA-binding response OmpR family regulator